MILGPVNLIAPPLILGPVDLIASIEHVTPRYLMIVTEASNYRSTQNPINIPAGTYAFINDGTYIPDAPSKDPSSTIDYGVDWSGYISQGEIITDSEWQYGSGITGTIESNNDSETRVMLTGGVSGSLYTLTNRITTSAGRVDERSMYILCEDR